MEFIKGMRKSVFFYSIISILFGIILLIFPNITSRVICYCIALMILLGGFVDLVRYFSDDFFTRNSYDIITGIVKCLIAILIAVKVDWMIAMIPFVVGIFVLIESILDIGRSIQLKEWNDRYWIADLLLSVLLLIAGIVLLVNPFDVAMFSVMFIGGCFVYEGILGIMILHRSHKATQYIHYYR